ncbi:MAG: hypothetical protein ACP5E3_10860 [Bacteroidales bacterium]
MKRLSSLIILSFLFLIAQAVEGEVYYYTSNYRPVETIQDAKYMKRVDVKNKRKQIIKSFIKEGKAWKHAETVVVKKLEDGHHLLKVKNSILFSTRIHRYFTKTSEGLYKFKEQKGEDEIRNGFTTSLIPLHLQGEIREYYLNGQLKTIALYENNQLQENENWLSDGTEYYDNIYYSVDREPEYTLGFGNFRNHILAGIKKSGYDITQVNEKIVLGWVILENGKLAGVHKVSGKSVVLPAIIAELVETLPGDWSPASLEGEEVRYYMTIPFNFIHHREDFENLELNNGFLIWD